MGECVTRKRMYASQELAEQALIEAHIHFNYRQQAGPIAIYKCSDCGQYHFTSQGAMNSALAKALADGKVKKQQEINRWEDKFRKR